MLALLPVEDDISSEHARDAGNLFLLVHHIVTRHVGLEIEGNFAANSAII